MDNINNLQSDKMRNKPIGKLLLEMSLPAIISMLVQSLYNIVDSLFVTGITEYNAFGVTYNGTNLGNDSFNAVSIVSPLTYFVVAIAIGIGVGANAYIARKLGEGNREKANQAAKTAIVIAVIAWLVLIILAFTVTKPFVKLFVNENNATDIDYVVEQATLYASIFMIGSIGCLVEISCSRILQSTGNMKVPMISQLIGAITNIVLDALFIIVFKWGVIGAIVATVIGQWCSAIFVLVVFKTKKQDVDISLSGFKMQKHYVKQILRIGAPAFIMNAMSSVVTIILNIMLTNYATGITVLSAYFKVQSFVFMPVFGLMQGTMPILSYNYGANERQRFNKTFLRALTVALCVLGCGLLLFQFAPDVLMSIFKSKTATDSENALLVSDGAYAFRVISISFIPAAFSILIINMLQSINSGITSLLMSLCRQLIVLIPSAIILNALYGQRGIWFAYPIAEILSLLAFTPFAINIYKKNFAYKESQYQSGELHK